MSLQATSPAATYRRRIEEHRRVVEAADGRDGRFGSLRLAAFGLGIAALVLVLTDRMGGWVLLPAFAAFGVVVVLHGRSRRRRAAAERRVRLYERGLARIEDRWSGDGPTGETYRPERHPYAGDVDLFGRGSLFQLLATARTRTGEGTLARWLLEPAAPDVVRARQEAVETLRARVDLREAFALAGDEVGSALDRGEAAAWVAAPARLGARWRPGLLMPLGIATAVLGGGWAFAGWPFLPFGILALLQWIVCLPVRGEVEGVLRDVENPSRDLNLVARLLQLFEAESFESGRLGELRRNLEVGGTRPSRAIAELARRMDFVDARRNQIFLPISWLMALGTQLAFSIEAWRARYGEGLATWLEALGELEALLSISAYAFEHPADPFPELVEGGARFEGESLGHPLLPAATNIRNDVALSAVGDEVQAYLVSGSNMSGKSTWLRTVGVNAVLAQAGAPVRAARLRLSSLRLGASIRVNDSLQEGASRFYAEIQRLHEVVDAAAGEPPVLFLLDEMLGGTNSHDRRIGAEAVIHTLLDRGAVGFVTTHDLALAEVAEREDAMENVHFEDRLEGDRMVFDYRIHPGVVTHSNALALMRAVGIEV